MASPTILHILDGQGNPQTLQTFTVSSNLVYCSSVTDPTTGFAANLLGSTDSRNNLGTVLQGSGQQVGDLPYINDAVAGTVQQVKASAGCLYQLDLINTTAANAYLVIWFLPSASVTPGTTAPNFWVRLGSTSTSNFAKTVRFDRGLGGSGTGLAIAGLTTIAGSTGAAISVSGLYC